MEAAVLNVGERSTLGEVQGRGGLMHTRRSPGAGGPHAHSRVMV